MSIPSRLSRVGENIGDALCWEECCRIAAETGEDPRALFEDAKGTLLKYKHLEVPLPNGMVDIGPMLRAIAEGEGFDHEELVQDVKRLLRWQAARERRAAKKVR